MSQPDQPPNDPLGAAVSTTVAPDENVAVQLVEQIRPAGELVTVPLPGPAKDTVREGPLAKQTTLAFMFPVTIARRVYTTDTVIGVKSRRNYRATTCKPSCR